MYTYVHVHVIRFFALCWISLLLNCTWYHMATTTHTATINERKGFDLLLFILAVGTLLLLLYIILYFFILVLFGNLFFKKTSNKLYTHHQDGDKLWRRLAHGHLCWTNEMWKWGHIYWWNFVLTNPTRESDNDWRWLVANWTMLFVNWNYIAILFPFTSNCGGNISPCFSPIVTATSSQKTIVRSNVLTKDDVHELLVRASRMITRKELNTEFIDQLFVGFWVCFFNTSHPVYFIWFFFWKDFLKRGKKKKNIKISQGQTNDGNIWSKAKSLKKNRDRCE